MGTGILTCRSKFERRAELNVHSPALEWKPATDQAKRPIPLIASPPSPSSLLLNLRLDSSLAGPSTAAKPEPGNVVMRGLSPLTHPQPTVGMVPLERPRNEDVRRGYLNEIQIQVAGHPSLVSSIPSHRPDTRSRSRKITRPRVPVSSVSPQ